MTDSPIKAITLLFTDIEGSTQLWENHPEAMRQALAKHDELVRTAIRLENGQVFKTVGDAFCAAFPTAIGALKAACSAQAMLDKQSWPGGLKLSVRMAIHSGEVESRDGDYFGQPLNRVSRLLAAGHGGQILVSTMSRELLQDALPADVWLSDLGDYHLRDLNRVERVFQVVHPDLEREFPALRSTANASHANNLPVSGTSFIGREAEVQGGVNLLAHSRLVTLAGIGGCGKTRLSIEIARNLLEEFSDGVWLVELASLADSSLVPQTVADALKLRLDPGLPTASAFAERLQTKQTLIVLDNCEHLLFACGQLADLLLRRCPKVKLLASSREPLGIDGERTIRVPPLTLPDSPNDQTASSLAAYSATQLFLVRTQLRRPDFLLTDQNAPSVARLCVLLDGIPLAIELAAARMRLLTVEEITDRLHDRFSLLTGGSKVAQLRQQSLRAAIDWSFEMLSESERLMLARLSVFSGGCTLEAIEAVCRLPSDQFSTLDMLTGLVDKSMVNADLESERSRYRLLETVRDYACERLQENGEFDLIAGRHRSYYLSLAEAAYAALTGPDQSKHFDLLEAEHDNLRAAYDQGDDSMRLRLANSLWWFWYIHGHFSEALERIETALRAQTHEGEDLPRVELLIGSGTIAMAQGAYDLAHYRYEEAVGTARRIGDTRLTARALQNLGELTLGSERYSEAPLYLRASVEMFQKLGDQRGCANGYALLASFHQFVRDYDRARELCETSISISRDLGDKRSVAFALNILGSIAFDQRDSETIRKITPECLQICVENKRSLGIAHCIGVFGGYWFLQGDLRRAATLWSACDAMLDECGWKRPPSQNAKHRERIEALKSALGEPEFLVAREAGRALTSRQATELSLDGL